MERRISLTEAACYKPPRYADEMLAMLADWSRGVGRPGSDAPSPDPMHCYGGAYPAPLTGGGQNVRA